jgi:hypothetical protein
MSNEPEYTREPWVYVEAESSERALAFLGAPRNWPVEWHRVSKHAGYSIWRVKSEGLVIR